MSAITAMDNRIANKDFSFELKSLQERFNSMRPELEVTVRDDALDVEGYIVVWNTAISRAGPLPNCAKGGTRIKADLSLNEIRMLARNMAVKNAAANLPLGGCKSGLKSDPRAADFESKYRRFIELCAPFTYENGGIFGGFGFDIGAAQEHALWACDTLGSTRSFTGKPVEMGGTDYDREGIAGLGVAEAAANLIRLHGIDPQSIRFAVHGMGAMGAAVFRYFREHGAQLSAIGDPKYGGAWRFEKGVSEELATALIDQNTGRARTLIEGEGALISEQTDHVMYETVEVLFPCAMQHAITADNARLIKARYIIEGANNPTTEEAYTLLHQRGIYQVPDFIANAGGIIAAFVEMTSQVTDEENARSHTKVQEAKKLTRIMIRENVARIAGISEHYCVSLRDAARYVALNALFKNG